MSGGKNGRMLKAGGLREKTFAKGGRYLIGWLDSAKVLIMANRDRRSDEPSHHLFFVEAPGRRQGGQERAEGPGGAADADVPDTVPAASERLPGASQQG